METGKGGANPPLSRSCEALAAASVSQNARQDTTTDEDRP